MPKIFVEGTAITGLFSFGHLYIVYQNDSGQEFVLRGGPELSGEPSYGHLLISGWNENLLLENSPDKRVDADGIPVTAEERGQKELPLGGLDVEAVWDLMKQYGGQIKNAELPYEPSAIIGWNSNSFVGALLSLVGLDINNFTPDSAEVDLPYPGKTHPFPIDTNMRLPSGEVRLELGLSEDGSGADVIFGSTENSPDNNAVVKLGSNNDRFEYTNGKVVYDGGDDVDEISFRAVDIGFNITLAGLHGVTTSTSSPNDVLVLFDNVERIYGSGGDDTFKVARIDGIGTIDGHFGKNTLDLTSFEYQPFIFDASGQAVATVVDLNLGMFQTAYKMTSISSFQKVVGSSGDDIIKLLQTGWSYAIGNGGNDKIYGGTGENFIYGNAGNDTFYYGGGKSTFYGGKDVNTLNLSLVNKGYLFDLGFAQKVVVADVNLQSSAETILFYDTQKIVGSGGNDTFKMYNKGLFVDGGDGLDILDLHDLNFNVGISMTVNVLDGTIKNSLGAFATFTNIETFLGTRGDDQFVAAGPVAAHFSGLAGLDTLWASALADWFDGGGDIDTADYRNSHAAVSVDLRQSLQHGGYAEGDQLFGVEHIVGSAYGDTLTINNGGTGRMVAGLGGDDDIFVYSISMARILFLKGQHQVRCRSRWERMTST